MLWPGVLGWEPPCEWAVTHGRGFPGHDYAASAWPAPASSAEGNRSSPKLRMQFPLVSFRYAEKTLELQRSDFKV